MTTHTPGPWSYQWVPRGDQRDLKVVDVHGALLTMNTKGLTGDAEQETNARLIAQAPAMLANENLGILLAEAFLVSHDKHPKPCTCMLCHDARTWIHGTRAILRAVEG